MRIISCGSVVKATAGRDKGEWFAVLALENGFAMIANGKSRPLSRPKRKSLKHLAVTGRRLEQQDLETDRKLRTALRQATALCDKEGNDLGKG